MDINELPSPQFLINEAGMISVFLPAFAGEPENPILSKKDDKTLHFQRSADGDVLLTEIDDKTMQALSGVKKILVAGKTAFDHSRPEEIHRYGKFIAIK